MRNGLLSIVHSHYSWAGNTKFNSILVLGLLSIKKPVLVLAVGFLISTEKRT